MIPATRHRRHMGYAAGRLRAMWGLLCVLLLCTGLSASSYAELRAMKPDELKSATAQAGIAEFTLNNNTARLFLDIHIETVATIGSFSAGYYNGGWDQSWNTLSLGADSDTPLVMDGLVFIADFDDLSAGDPTLERVILGSNRLQGSLSAMISSFSGMYSSSLTSGGSPDTILTRYDLSSGGTTATTFEFNSDTSVDGDQGLFLILNMDSSNTGIQVLAGYNENTIPDTAGGTPWWDSP